METPLTYDIYPLNQKKKVAVFSNLHMLKISNIINICSILGRGPV